MVERRGAPTADSCRVRRDWEILQLAARQQIIDATYGAFGSDRALGSNQEALVRLLEGRSVCGNDTSLCSTAPLKRDQVSLPEWLRSAPLVEPLLPEADRGYLERFQEKMLRLQTQADAGDKIEGVPPLYMDLVLENNPQTYVHVSSEMRKHRFH